MPESASPSTVSQLLAHEIEAFDDALLQAVADVFLADELGQMTADEVSERMKEDGVEQKVILASRGTTGARDRRSREMTGPALTSLAPPSALICLISPDKRSLWTANVGDCQARQSYHVASSLLTRHSGTDAHPNAQYSRPAPRPPSPGRRPFHPSRI